MKGEARGTSVEFPKIIRKGENLGVVGLVLKTKTGAPTFLARSVEKLSN